jgi:cytochrome P450
VSRQGLRTRSPLEWLHGSALDARRDILGFYRRCEQEGGVVRTHIWRLPVYVVTDPELVEEILIRKRQCFIKSAGLRSTRLAFGQGLLTSDHELWLRQRRTVQAAFHARQLELYRRSMEEACRRLLDGFRDGETRNIHHDMTELCFEVLARSLFGEELPEAHALVAATAEALHAFHHLFSQWVGAAGGLAFATVRGVANMLGRPDFVLEPTLLPTSYARRFREAVRELDAFVEALIERRRGAPRGEDFLSLLLSARDEGNLPLEDRQIRDEIVTMFLAGHETAASSLSWTLYLLAAHPEVAREMARQLDDGGGAELLEQVTREGLRLYPPAYRISRTTIARCRIGEHEVKPGAEIMIPQWAIQRSGRWFEEPDEFRPERWTRSLTEKLPRFAYLPFGGGPRTCIGSAFAQLEASVVLGATCRRFTLSVPGGFEAEPFLGVTLLPKDNTLLLEVRRREARNDRGAAPSPTAPRSPADPRRFVLNRARRTSAARAAKGWARPAVLTRCGAHDDGGATDGTQAGLEGDPPPAAAAVPRSPLGTALQPEGPRAVRFPLLLLVPAALGTDHRPPDLGRLPAGGS